MRLTKTDEAWGKLFEKYQILEAVEKDSFFRITATQINEFREARLMTKFDHSDNLPQLFKDNKLAILPDSRGTYIIGRFKAYQALQINDMKPITMTLPDYIQSVDTSNITSEAVALNVAHASGMIDYIADNYMHNHTPSVLTLSGRMGSGDIDYRIKSHRKNEYYDISVTNSQIEIDGSYETANDIILIEAKNKLPKDFLIRQLYYPYRFYKQLPVEKKVTPIFFTYADEIFNFYEYEFQDLMDYTSIKKVNQYSFILNKALTIHLDQVLYMSKTSPMLEEEESIIFPQADNFSRILDMLDYLEAPKSKSELAEEYEFDERQSDYYANALIYLDLATKNNDSRFVLNEVGNELRRLGNNNERNKLLVERILSRKIFKLAFDHYVEHDREFDRTFVAGLILK
ncbi:MAG TPA: hypothetical protein VK067_01395, partial [Pseudogracilibacillus sp.]|nr:hypothetical protein [Pseudogracilibacillus sp.]